MTFPKYIIIILLCAFTSIQFSCKSGDAPDTNAIKYDITFEPFYKDYTHLDTNNLNMGIQNLAKKYPYFTDFYFDTILSLKSHSDPNLFQKDVKNLLSIKDYKSLIDTVNLVFKNTDSINNSLTQSIKLIHYYLPKFPVPNKVIYLISYLQTVAFTQNDQTLGISLDMFLGANYAPYRSTTIDIPSYKLIQFTPKSIPVWASLAIYNNKIPFVQQDLSLIEMIVERGKEQFFLSKVTPQVPANLRFGFTDNQLKWCQENEEFMYKFLVQNDYLYLKDFQKIAKYVMDGPTPTGFPEDCPGNIGNYLGYRIVSEFVKNTNCSLDELLQNNDYQSIFAKAKYNP